MDRQLERLLSSAGRIGSAVKPVLEINPRHEFIRKLATLKDNQQAFREVRCPSSARPSPDPRRRATERAGGVRRAPNARHEPRADLKSQQAFYGGDCQMRDGHPPGDMDRTTPSRWVG
jgi:hypothetical protein